MSEENKLNEAGGMKDTSGVDAGNANQTVDDLMKAHMERWQGRAQIIVALVAVFLLYMIWFMLHNN